MREEKDRQYEFNTLLHYIEVCNYFADFLRCPIYWTSCVILFIYKLEYMNVGILLYMIIGGKHEIYSFV